MLSVGLVSAGIAMKLPGSGTIYMKQEVEFKAPVYIGDTITAQVEVVHIDETKNRVTLKTICLNQDDKVVVDGEAIVSPPPRK